MNPQIWCKTPLMKQICYGELHKILVCEVPPSKTLNTQLASTHLLMLVSNCQVYTNAAVTPASYAELSKTTKIIALVSVSSVCGHFPFNPAMGLRWAIVNCSMEFARLVFSVDDDDDDDDDV